MVHIKQIFKAKKKRERERKGRGWVVGGLRGSTLEPQEELESRTARPCEIQAGFLVLYICSSLCICFFLFLGLPVSTA